MGLEKPNELYVDAAYVSADKLVEAQAEGREIIGPAQRGMAKENRFGVEAFDVRVEERQATCPAGKVSTQCSRLEDRQQARCTIDLSGAPTAGTVR